MIAIATPRNSSIVVPAAMSSETRQSPAIEDAIQKITPMIMKMIPTMAALRGCRSGCMAIDS